MKQLVSIIIINYNTDQLIRDCIKSIYAYTNCPFEIIVVDNASKISPENWLRQEFPEIKFIENKENTGFSRANNTGASHAQGELMLFLNSDTLFTSDTLSVCLDYIKHQKKQFGVLSCRLNNPDGSLQNSFHWSAVTFKKVIQANPIYIKFFGKRISKKHESKVIAQHLHTGQVSWVSGAFMLIPRSYYDKYKYIFDEDFFMYSEDVELCFRMNRQDLPVIYFPETSIIHIGGGGIDVLSNRYGQIFLSELLAVLKVYGKIGLLCYIFLLRTNHLLDKILSQSKQNKTANISQLERNRIEKKLIREHFFTFILRYSSNPNSGSTYLRHAEKVDKKKISL